MYKYLSITILSFSIVTVVYARISVLSGEYGNNDIDTLQTEESSFAAAVANEGQSEFLKSVSDSEGPASVHQVSSDAINSVEANYNQNSVSKNIAESLKKSGDLFENVTEAIKPQNILDKISESSGKIAEDSNDELNKLKQERTLLSAAKYGAELVKKTAAQFTGGMATMIGHPLETAGGIGGAVNNKLAEGVEVAEQYARGEIDAVEVGAIAADAVIDAVDTVVTKNNSEIAAAVLLSVPLTGAGKVPKTQVRPKVVNDVDLARVGRDGYPKLGVDARDYSSVEQLVLAGKEDVAMKFIKQKFPNTQVSNPQDFLKVASKQDGTMTVYHGTSSPALGTVGKASETGVTQAISEQGLIPGSSLKKQAFTGEQSVGSESIKYKGINDTHVSVGVGQNGMYTAKEYAEMSATKWNPELGRKILNDTRKWAEDVPEGTLAMDIFEKEIQKQERYLKNWDSLTLEQQRMVQNPFPVVIEGQASSSMVTEGVLTLSPQRLPGEAAVRCLTPSKCYVPRKNIAEARDIFKDSAGDGHVQILPLEELDYIP